MRVIVLPNPIPGCNPWCFTNHRQLFAQGETASLLAMADAIYLFLKANGQAVEGECERSKGREGSIECLYFEDRVRTPMEAGTNHITARRIYAPMKIIKRIDKTTPLLAKAMCNNEALEGELQFWRPVEGGDGSDGEHYFTIALSEARISEIRRVSPRASNPDTTEDSTPYEEVYFVFHTVRWVYQPSGAEHEDNWRETQ